VKNVIVEPIWSGRYIRLDNVNSEGLKLRPIPRIGGGEVIQAVDLVTLLGKRSAKMTPNESSATGYENP